MRPAGNALLASLVASLAVGCVREGARSRAGDAEPPRRRLEGARSIPFAGGDPAAKGWVQVDGLLWVEAEHADAFRRGLLFTGGGYEPTVETDRRPGGPRGKYALRTSRVLLETNVAFSRARELAGVAERHVDHVLAFFGVPLDLRLPADPLPVVVAARRDEFERLLRDRVARPVDWGAFYSPKDGAVFACEERRAQGGLPVVADLRHEMTHALLDLGRGGGVAEAMFSRPHFWIWEGAAVHAEGFGDPPGAGAGRERAARLRRRVAWGEHLPLPALFALSQEDFQGRHYDQAGALATWLFEAEGGRRRAGALALLLRAMSGEATEGDFERLVGLSPEAAESAWLAASSR
jgi:hypothetical protein